MKRFYDEVGVRETADGWQVTLDGRGLKTVNGASQVVPTQSLARALADEWSEQGEELETAKFVARDMADYTIDVIAKDRAAAAQKLVAYGDTDTLLYRADPDEPLYARQQEVWEPILTEFERREGVEMVRVSGIIHRDQDKAALAKLQARLEALDPFQLTATEMMTSLAASLIVGLSAAEAEDEPQALELWRAASLEEDWQADLWGRDHEAEEVREKRQASFLAAHRFGRQARF